MEETQKQSPLLPRLRRWLVRRHILYQNSNVTNATAKFLWEGIERLLDYLDEMFTLHPSPTELNNGTLTPSSRRRLCRHRRHLLCRRLRLPLRLLPRLALVEGGHRQLPTDQKGLSRGILAVFCSCSMVRLVRLCKRRHSQCPSGRNCSNASAESILVCSFGCSHILTFLSRGVRSPQACREAGGAQLVPAPGTAESSDVPVEGKLIKPYHRIE